MDQSFTEKSFWKVLRKGDAQAYSLGKNRAEIREALKLIETAANKDDFTFSRLDTQQKNQTTVYSTTNRTDEFILRKISDNLKRALRIKHADRHEVLPQVIQLTKESRDCSIHKIDLRSFFENIDRQTLLDNLSLEQSLSKKNIFFIERLFSSPLLADKTGLPRGLSISPALAEYYLQGLEKRLRQLTYCHFYTRYVDDMLFFCHGDSQNIEQDITNALPRGLSINTAKSTSVQLDKIGLAIKKPKTSESFAYLGYKITFPTKSNEKLTISIPKNKINKIKTRITLSFVRYIRDNNYEALRQRLRFLTSNFKIGGSKQTGTLFTGIHYNHKHVDTESADQTFSELDNYLCSIVHARNGSIGKKLASLLTNKQRRELCGHSFLQGHKKPVYRHLKNKEIAEATKVWEHA